VFLVAPAIAAVMLTDRRGLQLVIGWLMGTLATVAGMAVSYYAELPSGPTVVALYGLVLAVVALIVFVVRSERPRRSLGLIGAGAGAVAGFVGLVVALGFVLQDTSLGRTDHHHESELPDPSGQPHAHEARTRPPSLAAASTDPEVTLARARAEMNGRERTRGLARLVAVLRDGQVGAFFKQEALALLEREAGRRFAYDPDASPAANAAALAAIDTWLASPAASAAAE
jgi:hypothetical protein